MHGHITTTAGAAAHAEPPPPPAHTSHCCHFAEHMHCTCLQGLPGLQEIETLCSQVLQVRPPWSSRQATTVHTLPNAPLSVCLRCVLMHGGVRHCCRRGQVITPHRMLPCKRQVPSSEGAHKKQRLQHACTHTTQITRSPHISPPPLASKHFNQMYAFADDMRRKLGC